MERIDVQKNLVNDANIHNGKRCSNTEQDATNNNTAGTSSHTRSATIIPKAVQVQIPRCSSQKQPHALPPSVQVLPTSGTVTPLGNGVSSSSHSHTSTTALTNGNTASVTGLSSSASTSGRIKAPPICRIPSLRKEHMSSDEMSKWCFTEKDVWSLKQIQENRCTAPISNPNENDDDTEMMDQESSRKIVNQNDMENDHAPISPKEWKMHKKNILNQNESRNGRETQRFATDAQTGQLLRLTTGCVPIMRDGRILLVSSSRKGEWILPKGGWESDETMEVSALRETYEEGGILGLIGPKLSGIDFETRKAKKRRLELESSLKKKDVIACNTTMQQQQQQDATAASSTVSVQSNASSLHSQSEDDATFTNAMERKSPTNRDCLATKIRNELNSKRASSDRTDDSASIASSNSSICTHVRLCMFPLYVLEVRENWPESGRARKVVDIDTAIETMASRPEFHQVLMEVKRKGYHLKPHFEQQESECENAGVETIVGNDQVETILSETII